MRRLHIPPQFGDVDEDGNIIAGPGAIFDDKFIDTHVARPILLSKPARVSAIRGADYRLGSQGNGLGGKSTHFAQVR